MDVYGSDELADRFETHRAHLRTVAYRVLGSPSDADDAVQEAWLRLSRVDAAELTNLSGWLTTVVSRVCLDVLRARAARREEPAGDDGPGPGEAAGAGPAARDADPERAAVLADSVGRALLVVLDRLGPAERVAFVLHDVFAVPFDEIAPIVGRTVATTKKLASRARGKVRGGPVPPGAELARQRRVVEAFLAAARAGDVDAVLAVLAPDVVRRADRAALPAGRPLEARGARTVAQEIAVFGRNARFAELALVNGSVGIVVAPEGRLRLVLTFTLDLPGDELPLLDGKFGVRRDAYDGARTAAVVAQRDGVGGAFRANGSVAHGAGSDGAGGGHGDGGRRDRTGDDQYAGPLAAAADAASTARAGGRIAGYELVADPARLDQLALGVLEM